MGKQKQPIIIIGEGPTEFYYFNSLKDELRGIRIEPDYPKHSSLNDLEKKIQESIVAGYAKVLCVIDMDNKDDETIRQRYLRLKAKFAQPVVRKGMPVCEVKFYETHRCTELFFLYYFRYTSKNYADQESLIADICKHCFYEKTENFFRRSKGLHTYFEKNGGSLDDAVSNAKLSMAEKQYTYSQLGEMIELLRAEARKAGGNGGRKDCQMVSGKDSRMVSGKDRQTVSGKRKKK